MEKAGPKNIEEISPEASNKVKNYRYDILIEKHELFPWKWDIEQNFGAFLNIGDLNVLLPVGRENQANISVLRCIISDDRETLTIFLKDTTYYSGSDAGFVAVCERVPLENWYIAFVYHACRLVTSRDKVG
ncbi:conserved hypothetical protein [Syntrophobacter sp. SbD1]|nr:conserved hypothetical protein [Syntrophobacter sp. SbD1]